MTCETNNVSLKVYDLTGREVETLVSGRLVEGLHHLQWDADMLPTGVYVLRLTANNHTQTNKVVLVR